VTELGQSYGTIGVLVRPSWRSKGFGIRTLPARRTRRHLPTIASTNKSSPRLTCLRSNYGGALHLGGLRDDFQHVVHDAGLSKSIFI